MALIILHSVEKTKKQNELSHLFDKIKRVRKVYGEKESWNPKFVLAPKKLKCGVICV